MTSGPHPHASTASTTDATRPHPLLRLRLKPKAPPTGYVDGGWWPRSRDLVAELPALAEVLAVRLGSVSRVAFAITGWDAAPRRVTIDGRTVRLEGFRAQDAHVVHVSGPDRQRISLLVVPPDATDASGHGAIMTASRRANADTPTEILTGSGALTAALVPEQRSTLDDEKDRWQGEGGRVNERA
ncbi:MAG TPA: DUF5994 family protein [Pseudonocardiaceae bacterium]|jgi:hypothetical protein|nr:DUF5994 family protein [Pseudonocardiaceae bacterium]